MNWDASYGRRMIKYIERNSMGQTNQIQGSRFRYVLLILIALIWGSQFLLNDLALEVFTPQAVSWLRATIGFLTLSGLLFILPEAHDNTASKISYWSQIIMIVFLKQLFLSSLLPGVSNMSTVLLRRS